MNETIQFKPNTPAGFVSRFEAFIIDLIILTIVALFANWFLDLIIRFFALNLIFGEVSSRQYAPVIFFLIVLVYYLFFWAVLGYTPGKLLLGLKIIRQDGRKLSFGRSILRFFGYWVSAVPLFFGFIWIILDHKRQGWHDKLADTQVIYFESKSAKPHKR